jgi:hypothetical protein
VHYDVERMRQNEVTALAYAWNRMTGSPKTNVIKGSGVSTGIRTTHFPNTTGITM